MDKLENDCYESIDDDSMFIVHPIKHLTRIECMEGMLNKIKSSEVINAKFNLGIKRINRWWWSVAFIDRSLVC